MSNEYVVGNIGERERARLRWVGRIGVACAAILAAVVIFYQVPWWVYLTLFFSLWSGISSLVQAKENTSVRFAARRVRKIDGKEEPEQYVLEFRGRARTIQRRSLFVTVLLMILVTLLG